MDVANPNTGRQQIRDEVGIRCQKLFQGFLEEFHEDGEVKYLYKAQKLTSPDRFTLEVSFDDVEKYNQTLATAIIEEYYRLYPFLCQAVTNFVKDRTTLDKPKDCYVSFSDVPTRHRVRQLSTQKIGTLIRISGQVVRTHPVHPELVIGVFICLDCQTETTVQQQFKYTNPVMCRNPVCTNRRNFTLNLEKSKFIDFQKAIVQEVQSELPRGCIPRSVEIVMRSELVESVQAGDRYDFTGTLIVVPDVGAFKFPGAKLETSSRHKKGEQAVAEGIRGLKALGVRDLNYKVAFWACSVQATTTRFGGNDMPLNDMTVEEMKQQMTDAEWNRIYEMSKDKNLFQNLMNGIFSSIHGNDEVKRGILLQLFGGVAKTTHEKTTLRGDINICIVGDPSTAKSQALKIISDFWPSSIYTSGKASTAAGLTAAVVRDEDTGDPVIEAGALILANNGICCIDEFDKMDNRNQVAIHEAMEQQTISIAKAGVRATLNARTSILAAANPIYGRYDRSRSLTQNINLTAPIISRFDLFFILVDECDEIVDYSIARKIVDLHANKEDVIAQQYTEEEIMQYITFAKQFKPVISKGAADLLVANYNHLRQKDVGVVGKDSFRVTVRQLESMVRLSEAMAKMECSNDVEPKHVKEAFRLLSKSIIRVEQPDIHLEADEPELSGMEMDSENIPENGQELTQSVPSSEEVPTLQKKTVTLTFEDYKNLTNMIVTYIRSDEEAHGSEDGYMGVRQSEVVNWYLEKMADQIDTEEELIERKTLVDKVIDRLVNNDQVLFTISKEEYASKKQKMDTSETVDDDETDPCLLVHPNYVIY